MRSPWRFLVVACLHGLVVSLGSIHAQVTRVGGEFQVNVDTTFYQVNPSVAIADDGHFVVVWMSNPGDAGPNSYGIHLRLFSSTGTPQPPSTVNVFFTSNQSSPRAAMTENGDFVVVWNSDTQDGGAFGVFGRRFDTSGVPQANEFQVNAFTGYGQILPAVAVNDNDDFVVVWKIVENERASGRRFDFGGPQGSEFPISPSSTMVTTKDNRPTVAIADDGDFVVVWESDTFAVQHEFLIAAQRFDAVGSKLGTPFAVSAVNLLTAIDQAPAAAVDAEGDLVVVWQSQTGDGSGSAIFGRRFDSAGVTQGDQFQVNSFTTDSQFTPRVAMDANGRFVVVWTSNAQDGQLGGVFARTFSAAGAPEGSEFRANSYTPSGQYAPDVALNDDGKFVVSWVSYDQDGSTSGVFAQRYTIGNVLDIDGDGEVQPLTDGLLALRWLFGFTGNTLTGSAVDLVSCTRCTNTAIEAYLAANQSLLDIDGDGDLVALTDGLLMLRYMFGFTGNTLIGSAVDNSDCTRCDAPAIENKLEALI